jgi:hypothetical protein
VYIHSNKMDIKKVPWLDWDEWLNVFDNLKKNQ